MNLLVHLLCLSMFIGLIDGSSILLKQMRQQKTILFQSKFSSPTNIIFNSNSTFQLTCSFLSNFPIVDVFWLHNGTLIRSFISTDLIKTEDEDSYLAVSIVSTLTINKIHFDMHGFYQCIAIHQEIYAKQTFYIEINSTTNSSPINYENDTSMIIHTSQALFEPRRSISILCRIISNDKDQCRIRWLNFDDQLIELAHQQTDLIISNGTFDDQMGLYTCQICCSNQCQHLSAFIYPAAQQDN